MGAAADLKNFKSKDQYYAYQMVSSFDLDVLVANVCDEVPKLVRSTIDKWCGGTRKSCARNPVTYDGNICFGVLEKQVSLSNYFFQWALDKAFQKKYSFPNAVYIDGMGADGIQCGAPPGQGMYYFPYQRMIVASTTGEEVGLPKSLRKTWDDFGTGRYASPPAMFPEGAQVCTKPAVRTYKADPSCKAAVNCESNQGL